MDPALVTQRVELARVGRLGTITAAGRPHLVPVCFTLRDDIAYTAVDAKPKSTLDLRRLHNIDHEPAACLLVDHYDEEWAQLWWVRMDGTARVVESAAEAESAKAGLRAKYSQYGRLAIPGQVIALTISGWVSWP
jgi:PPOX class probable F420-dependent enzyme